jgi:hypothetical protein
VRDAQGRTGFDANRLGGRQALESRVLGNGPVLLGGGHTEKGGHVPRRVPTLLVHLDICHNTNQMWSGEKRGIARMVNVASRGSDGILTCRTKQDFVQKRL